MTKLRVYTACSANPADYQEAKALGAIGILTNSNLVLEIFGSQMTLKQSAQKMLEDSGDMLVFQSIQGEKAEDIVNKALDIYELDPQRLGFKIVSNPEGFKAMRELSRRGIRTIATGMFTYQQAYMAAVAGCYAISPFLGRGRKAGYDMSKTIRDIRALYDRIEGPLPELLAASIHNKEEAMEAFLAGADSVAITLAILKDMCCDPFSQETEEAFGAAFARIKGEDVSYLNLKKTAADYQE
jgi:transaldolase